MVHKFSMRVKNFFLICAFLGIVISCSIGSDNNTVDVICLKAQAIDADTANNNMYTRCIVGNICISREIYGKEDFYGSIIENGKESAPELIFRTGHGRNEFGNMVVLGRKENNSLLILDNPSARPKSLTTISEMDSIESIKNTKKWETSSLTELMPFRYTGENFYSITDSTILVAGAPWHNIGHIFSIIDYKNKSVLPLKFWPEDDIKIDSLVKHSIYTNHSYIFGNGNGRYLYKCGAERFAFIFEIEGDKVNVVKNLYTVYPNYYTQDKQNFKYKSRKAEELKATVDNKNIYILLTEYDKDGVKREEWRPDIYGNIIEVYDWDGNKQKEIQLDHYGQRIILSDDHNKIYLFSDDYFGDEFNPEIWVYDLRDLRN